MHKRKIFIIIAVLAALILASGSSYYLGTKSQQSRPETVVAEVVEPQASSAYNDPPVDADTVFNMVNARRTENGLQPLSRNQRLDASAQEKCNDIATRGYWSHEDPDGRMSWYLFEKYGFAYKVAGENLAKDYATSYGLVDGWMGSPGHRANILNHRFVYAGIGACANPSGGKIIVQHYAAI